MNDFDNRLAAALGADAPPARDVLFRHEVLLRLERARFRRRVALSVAAVSVIAVFAAVNAPAIQGWIAEDVRRLWIVALGAAAAMLAPAGALVASTPGVRTAVSACGRWLYGYGPDA